MSEVFSATPPTLYMCWTDGTRARTVTNTNTVMTTSTTTVKSAAGQCYSVDATTRINSSTIDYTWKMANGNAVAYGTAQMATPNLITITCSDDTSFMVDTNSAACQTSSSQKVAVPTCSTTGSCSF